MESLIYAILSLRGDVFTSWLGSHCLISRLRGGCVTAEPRPPQLLHRLRVENMRAHTYPL